MDTKICSKCGRELPIECFNKSSQSKDGLRSWCKGCRKQYRQEHREEISEYKKRYREEHKEEISAKDKQYRIEHKEELSKKKQQYYLSNKDDILARLKQRYNEKSEYLKQYAKQYRLEHPEYNKEYYKKYYSTLEGYCRCLLRTYKHSDKKYNRIKTSVPNNYITLEFFTQAVQQPCTYCKKHKIFTEMGLDRKDNSLPHTIDNCVPCCTECNVKRGRWYTHEEFKDIKNAEKI